MTKREAAIISAYTGIMIGEFHDLQVYAEEKLETPLFTHQFTDRLVINELKEASKEDFMKLNADLI